MKYNIYAKYNDVKFDKMINKSEPFTATGEFERPKRTCYNKPIFKNSNTYLK